MDETAQDQGIAPRNGTPVTAPDDVGAAASATSQNPQAATNIYITREAQPQPTQQAPIVVQPSPVVVSTQAPARPSYVDDSALTAELLKARQQLNTPAQPIPMTTKMVTEKHINWGSVLKGAAIVAGVVLVGVVAFQLGGVAMGAIGQSTLFDGATTLLSPLYNAVTGGLAWLGGFLPEVPSIIGSYFSSLASGFGITNTFGVAAVGGAPYLIAGAAGATATAVAAPSFEKLDFFSTSQQPVATVDTTAVPDTQALQENGMLPGIFSKKAVLAQHASDATNPGTPMPGLVAGAVAPVPHVHDLGHLNHTAAEFGMHSLEAHGHHSNATAFHLPFGHASSEQRDHVPESTDATAPDMPEGDTGTARRTRNWRDRMAGSDNSYQQAYQSTGSYSAAIRAAQPQAQAPSPAPRASAFAQALTDDRARLDAALGEPART